MIIDVDMGNTRIKWRYADVPHSVGILEPGGDFPDLWNRLPGRSRFRVGSVVGEERTHEFVDRLASLGDVVVEIASVKTPFAGVRLAYADASTLGVDRWLALLSARARCPRGDCVVVHAGTALVADFLRADGCHQGGFITVGWQTSLRALGAATYALGAVVPAASDFQRAEPGVTTLECIEAGASMLYRGFLRELNLTASLQLESPKWIFTGGDAELLMTLGHLSRERLGFVAFPEDAELARELVLEGLTIALP